MNQPTDGELLESWRSGDGSAFRELVERHQAVLLHHARSILGRGQGAEDAVQEALLELANRPPELAREVSGNPQAERAQLLSWLHRVTRNKTMDTIRSETRRRAREAEAASAEATAGEIDRVEENDTRSAVERGLEKLPDAQREVLVLRLLGERSYSEIAEITGRKSGTVGWLISKGLEALSVELAHLMPATAGAPTNTLSAEGQA